MTPQRLLAWYEAGQITANDAVGQLCRLAAETDPATFAELLPAEWVDEVRAKTVRIPRPEEFFILRSVCNAGPYDPAEEVARERVEKERYVTGLRTWKAYFESVRRIDSPTGDQ